MQRYALNTLTEWLKSRARKPLVLRGARQIGKTWLVRELAKQSHMQLIELNFESRHQLVAHFESNDPQQIIKNLESALNMDIHIESAILFLDEMQAAPELFAKLRWFHENMPQLAVVAAGSLLEFVLENHEFSMPVGRINYFFLEPFGFEEFLLAKGELKLLERIEKIELKKPFNSELHKKSLDLFKEYMTVGGMPEAISTWFLTSSFDALSNVHNDLLNTYKDDFAKYSGKLSVNYLNDVLNSIPKQLTKKFMYSQVNPDGRHNSIKQALDLLVKSKIAHKVENCAANGIPIGAEVNKRIFKMIFLDTGLVSSLLGLNLYQFKNIEEIMLINKGAISEQVVGQLLRIAKPFYVEPKLYYWTNNANSEVDYIMQSNQNIIPIEVKSGVEGKLRSLHQFMSEKPWKQAVRFYAGELISSQINTQTTQKKPVSYELISIPFYLIERLDQLLA